MKRILALTLAAMLLLGGCGATGGDTDTNKNDGGNTDAGTSVTVSLGGPQSVTVGEALTASQKAALGTPTNVQEAPSCHYEGMDTVSTYNGFTIQTYRQGDADIVCLLEVVDRNISCEKGIHPGSTLDDVKAAYGTPKEATEYYVVYDLSDTVTITFELYGNQVSAVLYELAA